MRNVNSPSTVTTRPYQCAPFISTIGKIYTKLCVTACKAKDWTHCEMHCASGFHCILGWLKISKQFHTYIESCRCQSQGFMLQYKRLRQSRIICPRSLSNRLYFFKCIDTHIEEFMKCVIFLYASCSYFYMVMSLSFMPFYKRL